MLSIFGKIEILEEKLPFTCIQFEEDKEAGIIGIEAFGNVLGEVRYCYACYTLKDTNMYNNGEYEQLIELLKNNSKTIKIKFKVKKGKIRGFLMDIKSLAETYNDERFYKFELISWGLNDKTVASE